MSMCRDREMKDSDKSQDSETPIEVIGEYRPQV